MQIICKPRIRLFVRLKLLMLRLLLKFSLSLAAKISIDYAEFLRFCVMI